MPRRPLMALTIVLLALFSGALACDLSTDVAATALAPTIIPPPGTRMDGGGAITPGALISAAILQQNEVDRYTFHGEAGQAVTIDMEAGPDGSLDSYLVLRASDGSLLIEDDDSGTGLNSRIANYVLPETGDYTIEAHGYSMRSTGGYSLRFLIGTPVPASPTPVSTVTPVPGGGQIALGETHTGEIGVPGESENWTFQGRRGDIVTIDLRAAGRGFLDPYLELIGPDGRSLFVDDDGGSGTNARIANYVLPEDGRYTIRASGWSTSTGGYELTLAAGQPPTPTPAPPTPGPTPTPYERTIRLGQVVEGHALPNSAGDRYILQVEDSLVLEVLLEALGGSRSLYMELALPDGSIQSLVDFENAAPVVFLPVVTLRESGSYVLRVQNYGDAPVDYTLSLRVSELANSAGGEIDYDQGVSGELLYAGQEDYWTFEGHAGDVVTIIMDGIGMDSFLRLLNPEGRELTNDNDGNGSPNARIQSYTLPSDGTYTIVASSYRGRSYGYYRLLLFLEERSNE